MSMGRAVEKDDMGLGPGVLFYFEAVAYSYPLAKPPHKYVSQSIRLTW